MVWWMGSLHHRWLPWDQAWQAALYGPDGFFTTGAGPAAHFRTAVHAAPGPLASVIAGLARDQGCTAVLDIGAGRGELLSAMAGRPEAAGLGLHGVDVVPRPGGLPDVIGWSAGIEATPPGAFAGALVVAWELLDDVPCPVLEVDSDGVLRTVLVNPDSGEEELGGLADDTDLDWCRRWWPMDALGEGDRVEVGRPRDDMWAGLVRRAAAPGRTADGVLLAVDYAHERSSRPPAGSLSAFRAGRLVPPVPDGTADITAHVALDAVAAAGQVAGATRTWLTDQRTALTELGLHVPVPSPSPPRDAEPVRPSLDELTERSLIAELLDRGSLGSFGWLLQRV
jgi:SAM-dependent MidA family methyltransferase